jgi:ElaB/YqjD/DUF883 family membrane-anchored ribosome-binding protein
MNNVTQDLEQSTRIDVEARNGHSGNMAHKAAETLGTTAGYLRSHDLHEMMCDAEEAARRKPVPTLIGAAALGFLLGAFLRR